MRIVNRIIMQTPCTMGLTEKYSLFINITHVEILLPKRQSFNYSYLFYVTEGPWCITNSHAFYVLCLEQLLNQF